MRVLTQRELNRAVLARQHLLERATSGSLPRTLERVGGIQAQYAPSMYVGLWSRHDGLQRDAVTRALERGRVVQATLMRITIHLVSRGDFWPLARATRDARRKVWLRTRPEPIAETAMAEAARVLRERIAGTVLHRREIEELLGKARAGGVGLWLDLVRVPPAGTWERRRADLYALAEERVGPPPAEDDRGHLELLVRRYLQGFGPAAPRDIADWAGLPVTPVKETLARMTTRTFAAEDGTTLVDVPRARLPDPDTPAPPRFLPHWDATLLAHARRSGILPEEHRPRVFTVRNPQSVATFLLDGAVAGGWRFDDAGRVVLEPYRRLSSADRRSLEEEGARLTAFALASPP